MGEGRHVSFTLAAGGARSRCVSFGRGSALPAAPGEPVDAAVRLEVNRYNGAVEPRLVLRHARPARPAPIEVVGEPSFEAALQAELARDLAPWLGRPSALGHDPAAGPSLACRAVRRRPARAGGRPPAAGGACGPRRPRRRHRGPARRPRGRRRARARGGRARGAPRPRAARPGRRIRGDDVVRARGRAGAGRRLRARGRGRPAAARPPARAGRAPARRGLDPPGVGRGGDGAGPRAC